jgi:hypothetical protein
MPREAPSLPRKAGAVWARAGAGGRSGELGILVRLESHSIARTPRDGAPGSALRIFYILQDCAHARDFGVERLDASGLRFVGNVGRHAAERANLRQRRWQHRRRFTARYSWEHTTSCKIGTTIVGRNAPLARGTVCGQGGPRTRSRAARAGWGPANIEKCSSVVRVRGSGALRMMFGIRFTRMMPDSRRSNAAAHSCAFW